uniref:Calpain-5-like n=2 Tax=Scleropages formosus TaxID=113540 RepID=A0A8C9R1F8_SCLFO
TMSSVTPYKGQKYSVLKKSCWEANKLFEDPEFPTVDKSLFYQRSPPGRVEWKRPGEICDDPHFFVEGISSHDINQGMLGNCWFVAACSCLALQPDLWKKVIPNWKEQEWDPKHPESYAGIFHFCFWIFGEWIDVVIDDRLPTISGKLVYCHSKEKNEFWSALLEKAYAKLSTCYESLDGGDAVCALVDFSGGIAEHINLEKGHYASDPSAQAGLFKKLLKVYERNGMISCSIKASQTEREARMDCGLVKGHAYSVTAVRKIRLGQSMQAHFKVEKIPMIRMRNPWGKIEWKGPWSDGSEEWQRVGSTERESIGLTVEDDGEFWMAFDDWCKYFTSADVCHVINTSLAEAGKTWNKVVHYGSWTKHPVPILNRCGGCMNDKETFLQNPQYLFNMTKEEEEILVSLQQQDMKIHRPPGQGENLTIGFVILKVELNRKYRMHDILTQEVVATSTYINSRSVFMHKILPKGCYIIVPSTFTPEVLGDFMISVYTDVDSGLRVLTEDKPRVNCWSAYLGYPRVVTQIHIHGAEGLENQDSSGGADPYVVIHCEGKSVQSAVQKDTLDPIFDMRAIFYRKKPRKPIIVEVWNSNALQDEFMGQVVLTASVQDSAERRNIRLQNRGQDAGDETPGTITLRVITSAQLTSM